MAIKHLGDGGFIFGHDPEVNEEIKKQLPDGFALMTGTKEFVKAFNRKQQKIYIIRGVKGKLGGCLQVEATIWDAFRTLGKLRVGDKFFRLDEWKELKDL